ncbi:acyl-CoA N-acyltransferase [Gymnopus androsaceus JB14]|uniref:Acyl-CoA N-acyltransferase n=1 Tax=Gymnopus androsaceus JB14 TaxID=1447944 RepID=A0A6A4I318_9AGAR|nr:acyl-CoA N-acyltransferase [Gymnopus androsaceus JB14]
MFETDRLHLRAVREADFEKLRAFDNDPRAQKMRTLDPVVPIGDKNFNEMLRARLSSVLLFVIIETKDSHEFVGTTQLFDLQQKNRDVMLGLGIVPEFWGRGYGTEVVRFIVDYAFEQLGLHRVTLNVFRNNPAAIRVYQKAGFVQEGIQRKVNWMDGKWEDLVWMAVLDEDWEASRKDGLKIAS